MAKQSNTEQKVQLLAEPIAKELALILVDVEFIKEGPGWYLRIYLDKDGGLTLDDCEAMSRRLEKSLDETDPIEQAYILEVSSPGIDRPLKRPEDFVTFAGEMVDIKLYRPYEGEKAFQGKLLGLFDETIVIEDAENNRLEFLKKEVASVRLAVLF